MVSLSGLRDVLPVIAMGFLPGFILRPVSLGAIVVLFVCALAGAARGRKLYGPAKTPPAPVHSASRDPY